MSGGTVTPPLPQQSPNPAEEPIVLQQSPQAVMIEDRIHKTRRQVKGVDVIAGLLTIMVGSLVYLFAAALADHWLVSGGLGFWWRFLLWAILISVVGAYFVKSLWPALVSSINPVFAARTIEESKPTLKNSLINFLMLRGRRTDLAPVIYQALEQRAAADLRGVRIETAVDRRPVLRLSYLLLAVVGVICLYLALSPKSPLISAQRVLWPWTDLRAPTRVTVENVEPGSTVAFLGEFVAVSADVKGLNQDEQVLLHYSTADGEVLDQTAPMIEENRAYRRQAKLPPDARGLQQDYSYFITAGDFKTATYTIRTQIPPLITVDKVDYHYPPYTGIPDRSAERQGDLRAIEGTEITVHATANQAIDRAEIDFSGAGARGIRMDVQDRAATGRFTLRMLPGDPTRPEHDFYQISFTDKSHRKNPHPIRYNIEVLRDLPPEVQIVEPQKDETGVALDGRLEIRIRAEDPDFGLRRAAICAELGKQELKLPPLLDARPPEKAVSGQFQAKYDFQPKKFNLKPGDRVAYWAEAEDNKEPSPNLTASGRQWIVVLPPENPQAQDGRQPRPAQRPGGKSDKINPDQQNTNQQENEQPQAGQQQGDQQSQNQAENKTGEKGGKSDKAGKGDQGEKGQNEEKGKNEEKGGKGEKGQEGQQSKQGTQGDSKQSAGNQSQSANKGDSSQSGKSGEKAATSESGRNQQQSQGNQSGNQSGKAQQPIDPSSNPGDAIQEILNHRQEEQQKQQQSQSQNPEQNNLQQSGQQQSGQQQPGQEQSAGNQSANPRQQDNQQPGKQSSGNQPVGNKQSGGQQSEKNQANIPQPGGTQQAQGNKSPNDQNAAGQQQGEKQPAGTSQPSGEKQTGEKAASGEQSAGSKQSGENKPGENKPGENQSAGNLPSGGQQPGEKQLTPEEKSSGDKKPSGEAKLSGSKQGNEQPSAEKQQPQGKQSESKPGEQKSGSQDQLNNSQQNPGAGQGPEQPKPSLEAQGANQPRTSQSGQEGKGQNNKPEDGQSPGISPKQSKSEGESSGDRSGGGQQGGGQEAQQPGPGTPGSQTPANEGGSKSEEQGPGEVGAKPGEQTQSSKPTGGAEKQLAPQGSQGQNQTGQKESGSQERQSAGSSSGEEQQKPSEGGQSGSQLGKTNTARGQGNPGVGGQQGAQTDILPEQESQQAGADEANLDYARRQTELALEHLQDQLAKDKPDLLEHLGWTHEQAQQFIDRWRQLRQAAGEKGPRGEAAKRQFDDALKSLGLRPGTTYLKHGGTKPDQLQDLRDSGRFAPPPDWAEQFREYTRGVANQGKEAAGKEQGTRD